MTYTETQARWLRHHYRKWSADHGWSAATFALRVKQPAAALAEVFGLPMEAFAPPSKLPPPAPPAAAPTPPQHAPEALPDPCTMTVVLEPGVELMPRERPKPAPAPAPSRPPSPRWSSWRPSLEVGPGSHNVDGQYVECDGPVSLLFSRAGKHVVDQTQYVIASSGMVGVVHMPAAPTEDL